MIHTYYTHTNYFVGSRFAQPRKVLTTNGCNESEHGWNTNYLSERLDISKAQFYTYIYMFCDGECQPVFQNFNTAHICNLEHPTQTLAKW